jgi:hypothetical protein
LEVVGRDFGVRTRNVYFKNPSWVTERYSEVSQTLLMKCIIFYHKRFRGSAGCSKTKQFNHGLVVSFFPLCHTHSTVLELPAA